MAMATINPATGETEFEAELHTPAEVEARLAKAQEAHEKLRTMTYAERAKLMLVAADLIESEVEKTAVMLTKEMGKPIAQSRGEVLKCAKNMRFYAEKSEEFLAPQVLADPSLVGASQAMAIWQPLGVVLAVMPWNYPLWQVIRFAAPALMAGNSGVLKHASNVPQSALYLDDLFTRAGFPEGSFSTLMISASQVAPVIDDWRVRAVTLTGSEPAGRAVAAQAGSQIKPSVMELGGSDAFVVTPNADIEQAATVAVTARINNNGQSCIAGKRFLVFDEVYDQFVESFVSKMAALKMGDPMDESVQVGPLATAGGKRDIVELVEDAKAKGARVLCGGETPEGPGYYYPATVIDQLTDDMRLVMEEAFGPVATIYRVKDREEAIKVANQTTFGLSSAIWSQDKAEQDYFIEHLQAGAVFVNGMTISYPELAFGGIKDSGFGRELSDAGIKEFCNLKTVWKA
ncbi:aldehyde dehydrogenase family protein [Aquiluna sp.]|nr:aldehyde dehydrogenase family protein [Aquiluna sp.]MDA8901831.1 aldehyde dehydrogenase family protein [Aquiluna sp.]